MGGGTAAALTGGLHTPLRPGMGYRLFERPGVQLAVRTLGGAGRRLHAGVHWSHLLSVRRMAEVGSGLAPLGRG